MVIIWSETGLSSLFLFLDTIALVGSECYDQDIINGYYYHGVSNINILPLSTHPIAYLVLLPGGAVSTRATV